MMKYRRLGRTGMEVSSIGFGMGQLKVLERKNAVSIVRQAIEGGINYFDIDKDNDETILSEAMQGVRNKIILAGKSHAKTEDEMWRDINDTLKKFNVKNTDIYFLHMITDLDDLNLRLNGAMKALQKAQKQGRIRFLGITGHRIDVLGEAVRTNLFDCVMMPYNIMHQLGRQLFSEAKKRDMGIISFMTFGGGVLIEPTSIYRKKDDKREQKLPITGPLRFSLSEKGVHCVLIGTNKPEHLKELIDCSEKGAVMTEPEKKGYAKRVVSLFGKNFCRGCKYCHRDYSPNMIEVDRILRLKIHYERFGYKKEASEEYKRLGITTQKIKDGVNISIKCPYGINVLKGLYKAHQLLG